MTFNSLILIWFDQNKRNLPWRSTQNPYNIWLSEIILQQTRIAQGSSYYERFVETFPTVHDLANADEETVLKLWQGLGYYSRARNLHFTAKQLVQNNQGKFPAQFSELKKLKGIGDYTAAAIASISFGEAVPAVDGNAYRVYARYFDIDLDISSPTAKKYFFKLGLEIIDRERPGDFNQAVMELGATICTPKSPKCEICPVSNSCAALAKGKIAQLPVKSKKVKVKTRHLHLFHIESDNKILVKKQETNDVWRNLYLFPIVEKEKLDFNEISVFSDLVVEQKMEFKHVLTHQILQIIFWKLEVDSERFKLLQKYFQAEEINLENIPNLPVPRPLEKYFFENLLH